MNSKMSSDDEKGFKVADIKNGFGLDVYINDEDPWIRLLVARYGDTHHHDILVYDKDALVRCEVVKYGSDYHRDILMSDDNLFIKTLIYEYGNEKQKELLKEVVDKIPFGWQRMDAPSGKIFNLRDLN